MRILAATIAGWLLILFTAAPGLAASQQAHRDCDAGNPDRNIAGCTRIIDDPNETAAMHSIAYVARGLAWDAKGDRDRAMTDFNDAIRADPTNALAYNDRAILWREKGDPDHAIADFTAAIAINPFPKSDYFGKAHINIYTNRGLAWQAKGDTDRAIADFSAALRLDGNDAEAYFNRAQAFIAKRDLDHARSDLDAFIRLDPKSAYAYYLRGAVRYEQYIRAAAIFTPADLDAALADYSEAIRFDAANARAYYARGLAWAMDGKRDRAIADLTEAAKLAPGDAQIAAALKRLKP